MLAAEWLPARSSIDRRFIALVFVLALGVGLRATLVPVFICATTLLAVLEWRRERRVAWRAALLAVVSSFVLCGGMVFFYGLGRHLSGVSVVALRPLSSSVGKTSAAYTWLESLGLSETVASLTYIAAIVPARLTFILPGLVYYVMQRRWRSDPRVFVLCTGTVLAGIGAIALLESNLQEQWTFYWYGDICLALCGAAGLISLLRKPTWSLLERGLVSVSLVGVAVQAYDFQRAVRDELPSIEIPQRDLRYARSDVVNRLVARLEAHAPLRAVVMLDHQPEPFDLRVLATTQPGISLYASAFMLDVFDERAGDDPWLADRRSVVFAELTPEVLFRFRRDVPPDREALIVLTRRHEPELMQHLEPVLLEDEIGLWRIRQ
jgi:hypothetical protein